MLKDGSFTQKNNQQISLFIGNLKYVDSVVEFSILEK